jgi:DUF971 family protein
MEQVSYKPVQIDLERTRQLRIRWADGRESVYPLPWLRKACPCATCRAQREQERGDRLPVLPGPGAQVNMVTAAKADLVGRYALSITWMDGHTAGIYDFALLRALDPAVSAGRAATEREPTASGDRKKG